MGTKSIRSFLANYWQVALIGAGSVLLLLCLLFYQLTTLIPFASSQEALNLQSGTRFLHSLQTNPFFFEYKVPQRIVFWLHHQGLFFARGISAVFATIAVVLMYYILKKWHGARIAGIGTVLFASSSWFLTYARQATPEVTYILILTALAYGSWMRAAKRPGLIISIGVIVALYLVYTPGLVWFLVLALIWQRKPIIRTAAGAPKIAVLAVIFLIVLLSPLAYAIYQQPQLYKQLLGLPPNLLSEIKILPRNLWSVVDQIFINGQGDASIGLTKLALVDVFTGVMMILGLCYYFLQRKLDRAKILACGLALGLLLVSLHGSVSLVVLLPFIYILASAGIDYMLIQWYKVFPRNPLARNVGLGLVLGVVMLTGFYHINRYFVAWPNTPETKQVYTVRV